MVKSFKEHIMETRLSYDEFIKGRKLREPRAPRGSKMKISAKMKAQIDKDVEDSLQPGNSTRKVLASIKNK